MKLNFLIFFSTVLILYGLINYYIFIRGWQGLEMFPQYRKWYIVIFLIAAVSFFTGRILENYWISFVSDILIWIGSFWLAVMVYFFLSVLLIDFFRALNHFFPFFPEVLRTHWLSAKWVMVLSVSGIVALTVVAGRINALHPRITEMNIHISKNAGVRKTLHAVVLSDVHLGTIIGRSRLARLIEETGKLEPDVILFAGDLLDEDLAPVIRHDIGSLLKTIRAPLGVYAVTGNHEYIGGAEPACEYLADHGITMLRDTAVLIRDEFYLIGREDMSIRSFAGKHRKPLSEIMKNLDVSRPMIMMDHQPFRLYEASDHGIDLQLSGHTHHGQLWPFNYITTMIYELSAGYMKSGTTHYYVSTGAGTWGPPVRLGSRPEIVSLRITFQEKN